MSNDLPPITPEGFGGLLLWLLQTTGDREPDHELLLRGLPQGRILRARARSDGSIAVVFWDQRDKGERNERFFDPPGFFEIRGLCVPKTRVRYDHNSPDCHYIQLFGDISALRLLGDARPNEQVRQIGDHHDLRRANLYRTTATPGEKTKPTHQGRIDAKRLALGNLDKLGESFWLRRMLRPADYIRLLADGFGLLDRLPLGRGLKEAAE